MDILAKLTELGFTNAAVLNEAQGLVRVRTSKGWVYDRFKTEAQVEAWAAKNSPEKDDA
jgi:hypothetical protein